MDLANGKYFIRRYIDAGTFWYISGPPKNWKPGEDMHAIAKNINRATRTEEIREGDLAPECFVNVINSLDGNGIIYLRQSGTDRYAVVYPEQDEDDPKIAFLSLSLYPHCIGKNAEFQLIGPTGKDSVCVAIRSVSNDRYVAADFDSDGSNYLYLYPVLDELSHLFIFEQRFGYFNFIINQVENRKGMVSLLS